LSEYIYPHWIKGKKVELKDGENPSPDQTKRFKTEHKIGLEDGTTKIIDDLTKPFTLDFEGYYGFLTDEDKKDSSEGKETFGLTKTEGINGYYSSMICESDTDKKGNPKVQPPSSNFFSFSYHVGNTRKIKIGLEKRLFFNRLGYEE
jgi:hypothetical protein